MDAYEDLRMQTCNQMRQIQHNHDICKSRHIWQLVLNEFTCSLLQVCSYKQHKTELHCKHDQLISLIVQSIAQMASARYAINTYIFKPINILYMGTHIFVMLIGLTSCVSFKGLVLGAV